MYHQWTCHSLVTLLPSLLINISSLWSENVIHLALCSWVAVAQESESWWSNPLHLHSTYWNILRQDTDPQFAHGGPSIDASACMNGYLPWWDGGPSAISLYCVCGWMNADLCVKKKKTLNGCLDKRSTLWIHIFFFFTFPQNIFPVANNNNNNNNRAVFPNRKLHFYNLTSVHFTIQCVQCCGWAEYIFWMYVTVIHQMFIAVWHLSKLTSYNLTNV